MELGLGSVVVRRHAQKGGVKEKTNCEIDSGSTMIGYQLNAWISSMIGSVERLGQLNE